MEEREATDAPRRAVRGKRPALDLDLALLLLLVIGFNAPYLAARIVPVHDTFYNFATFHIFYSEFFFHGDLVHWYPYGSYGLPSDYEQIIGLMPSGYLLGLLGALLRVTDALLLFKLSVLLNQIVFVFGLYRLSGRLFPTRETRLVLCVAAAGASVWYSQQWWNLGIYYLLPLLLYFLHGFLEDRRPECLWLAGLAGVAWGVGNLPYMVALWMLLLLVVVGVAIGDPRPSLKALLNPSRSSLLPLALFLAAAAAYVGFLAHSLDGTLFQAPGRDPTTGRVSLAMFLSYGGRANLATVATSFLFGWPLQLPWGSWVDNTVYVGLLPLFGFGLAVARERSRFFLGLATGIVVLAWFSYGGAFTNVTYYLPGFSHYRHVSLVFALVKVLLLVASGYGLERLWERGRPRLSNPVILLVLAACLVEVLVALPAFLEAPSGGSWLRVWGNHVMLRIFVYGAALASSQIFSWSFRRTLLVAVAFDLAIFQFAVYTLSVPKLAERDVGMLEAARVREPHWQAMRLYGPIQPEASRVAFDLTTRPGSMEVYNYIYQFANSDPCASKFRSDYVLADVTRLLELKRREKDLQLDETLGCRGPKIRVVSGVMLARTAAEMERAIASGAGSDARPPTVIQLPAGVVGPTGAGTPEALAGRARVRRFTLNEVVIDVEVDAPDGAWLVYADAHDAGWHATVNGRETPLAVANLAFKAVSLPSGASVVRLWFDHGLRRTLSHSVALFAVAWELALVAWVGLAFGRGRARTVSPLS